LQQAKLTNLYQDAAKVPLMVAIDGEWGLAMRLSNTTSFPYQMGLGGIQDNRLIYEMGREIGRQCKLMGIHVNFAPVIDVNNNPNNPVINYRSFGENRENVAQKGWAYAKGMQEEQVLACAKHFPGHGDTDVDSHKDLPVINHSRQRLDSVEKYPLKQLIDRVVKSVMTAHLYIPAIDKRKNVAISISDKAINGILRKEMGFTGLAFTDALNMQGVAKFHKPGELELKAFQAGNDILLGPGNIPKATELIKKAIENGDLSQDYLDKKVRKILAHKFWAGLGDYTPVIEES
jgi:beta-glucosidase-like glycosyl hydrolase